MRGGGRCSSRTSTGGPARSRSTARQSRVVPLPVEVGGAIAAYLRQGRPCGSTRGVLKIASSRAGLERGGVSLIVRRAGAMPAWRRSGRTGRGILLACEHGARRRPAARGSARYCGIAVGTSTSTFTPSRRRAVSDRGAAWLEGWRRDHHAGLTWRNIGGYVGWTFARTPVPRSPRY